MKQRRLRATFGLGAIIQGLALLALVSTAPAAAPQPSPSISASPIARPSKPADEPVPLPTNMQIHLVRGEKKFDEIEISAEPLSLNIIDDNSGAYAAVEIRGQLVAKNWNLLSEDTLLVAGPSSDRSFVLSVKLKGAKTPIVLRGVGPEGAVKRETINVEVSAWEQLAKHLATRAKPIKRNSFSIGLGPTYLTYRDNISANYSSLTTTVKASYTFAISRYFDVGLNAFGNVVPLTTSTPGIAARFIGANARIGFSIPFQSKWRFSLLGGGYYISMVVTNREFGFSHLFGPQLFPTIRREINPRNAAYAYFKFSPVFPSLGQISFASNEIAAGGGWAYTMDHGHSLLFMVDWSRIQIRLSTFVVDGSSFSLSVGYGL